MRGNAAANPENEPNVMMYMITQKYICLVPNTMRNCSPTDAFSGTLFRKIAQSIPETIRNGMNQNAAFWSQIFFSTTFLTTRSVTTPASFFVTSNFMLLVASV